MRALLVTCVDGRIRSAIEDLEERLAIAGGDRLQVPGGPLALVVEGPQRQAMLAWIELLVRYKDVGIVYLVAHEHCLAYERKLGGFFHDEREVLERDLRAVSQLFEDAVYGVRVECHLLPWVADDHGGGEYSPAVPIT
jgi:hypothetical protein